MSVNIFKNGTLKKVAGNTKQDGTAATLPFENSTDTLTTKQVIENFYNELNDNKSPLEHTHQYAASASTGGAANKAISDENGDNIAATYLKIADASGGVYINNTQPDKTDILWIDTGNGGIAKYYNGTSWIPVKAVWG